MLKAKKPLYPLLLFIVFLFQHSFSQKINVAYKNYKIEKPARQDSALLQLLIPYADSLDKTMSRVIGFSVRGMAKRQPESALGNFITDCMKEMATQKFNSKVDAAFINFGGIRSYLPKGDITLGKMYELIPFDNVIVLQQVKGEVIKQFLDKTAENGGWPLSGITMAIDKNKKAVNVMIDGKPLDENTTYIIANSDYIANGGSECDMLRGIPPINIGYLLRDALIGYVEMFTKMGKPVDCKTENRIVYAN